MGIQLMAESNAPKVQFKSDPELWRKLEKTWEISLGLKFNLKLGLTNIGIKCPIPAHDFRKEEAWGLGAAYSAPWCIIFGACPTDESKTWRWASNRLLSNGYFHVVSYILKLNTFLKRWAILPWNLFFCSQN
jgi:hypothetical protein